ncbi:hypothetical protein PC116_g21454 [Phytophthora cactorum]|uniref:BZIP domain-containing protein n=1 Tax=Phytophthora cactorum TaxID=29920 RepID=A0A8T1FGX1_9STRA|nr:hypothetical protein PC112_g17332 [Phytophthora cactorum]KAG2809165.1 hypothetical protein PC111_g16166 [Phytophthora cactorum]KAG2849681.1 hypothetical protein PC113_g17349 [Phytophthora cactorum]KAG2887120.1 hypothetical protein PC114_g18942 [Phytophthora cactorum]KAG2898687.1 hypothetical protein PC115_g16764 [Phytophthora cactorum]
MSIVLLEDDEDPQATMQEAFAMIDARDEVPILSDIPNEKHSLSDAGGIKRSRQEQNRERDFRRRQRQKEERLQLQMQAQRLEMYLSQLRQCGGSVRSSETTESICVTPELQQQRVEAELLNMSLKKALTAEKKWSKSLQSVLDKRQSMETVSLASSILLSSTPSSVHCSPAVLRDDPVAVRREIMTLMEKMYHGQGDGGSRDGSGSIDTSSCLPLKRQTGPESRPNYATDVGNATKLQLRFI